MGSLYQSLYFLYRLDFFCNKKCFFNFTDNHNTLVKSYHMFKSSRLGGRFCLSCSPLLPALASILAGPWQTLKILIDEGEKMSRSRTFRRREREKRKLNSYFSSPPNKENIRILEKAKDAGSSTAQSVPCGLAGQCTADGLWLQVDKNAFPAISNSVKESIKRANLQHEISGNLSK